MFSATHGLVYEYVGTVPPDTNASRHITQAFVEAAGTNHMSTVVVTTRERHFIYTDLPSIVQSPDQEFVFLYDLVEG